MKKTEPDVKVYNRIFMIDDDVEDQEIFMEAVRKVATGIQCYTSTTGEDALKQLEHEVLILPDLIFLDMNLPKQNGKQILREIRNIRSLKRIPVIMYSTSFAPADIEETNSLGASFHLLKPTRFEDLCESLTSIFSKDWDRPGV
jgi:CheY-like chemotaxis protein